MKKKLFSTFVLLVWAVFGLASLGTPTNAHAAKEVAGISSFEMTENWLPTGVLDSKHLLSGKTSLKLTSTGFNWNAAASTNKQLDLSVFEKQNLTMVINLYTNNPENLSGVRLDLGSDDFNFYFANQQDPGFYKKGWNELKFSIASFGAQGAPKGWSSISWLRVNLAAINNNSTVDAWIDDWYISDQPSSEPIVRENNIKQVKGVSVAANNSENVDTDNQAKEIITTNIYFFIAAIFAIVIIVGIGTLWHVRNKKEAKSPPSPSA